MIDSGPMSLEEDRALLEAWCAGDKAAGDRLIRACFDGISRAVLGWVRGDTAAAVDIVQATFEVALKRRSEIRGAFGPYVRGIARRKVLEHFRRKDMLVDELTTSVQAGGRGAESVLLAEQQERLAVRALRQLSPEEQDLMYLRHVQGMKLRELAELEGVTIGVVAGILRRAEGRLAREVERLAESEDLRRSTLTGIDTWLRHRESDGGLDEPPSD